jgi:hypothetical protein
LDYDRHTEGGGNRRSVGGGEQFARRCHRPRCNGEPVGELLARKLRQSPDNDLHRIVLDLRPGSTEPGSGWQPGSEGTTL